MPISGPPLPSADPMVSLLNRGSASASDDEVALVAADLPLTGDQLSQASHWLAGHYLSLGLEPGDRVASLMPNRSMLVIHYIACLKAGLVATPLNYRYMSPEVDHALDVAQPGLLVHHVERDADVATCRNVGRLSKGVLRFGSGDERALSVEQILSAHASDVALPMPEPDAPAFIYFTSGSTGPPKGVTHTHRTFGRMMSATIAGMELTPTDTFLPAASLSHIGSSLFGLSTLAAGGRLIVARSTNASDVVPLMRQYNPTVLFMLPAALTSLVRNEEAESSLFRATRLCLSGGDKVSSELEKEFIELAGFPIDESYGMTETGIVALNPPSGENRLGSIGKLCPGYEISLRDDSGGEVPVGGEGQLWVRSAANMVGYWQDAAATNETIVDKWLDTGDIMKVDQDGYLWFCGRKKQIIVHDGSNICPQDVEEALQEHPAVRAAGVIGVHDLVHGENVRAYVAVRSGEAIPTGDELIRFARQRVGYKAPEEIVFLDDMPVNATGKVDRTRLKQMAEETFAI